MNTATIASAAIKSGTPPVIALSSLGIAELQAAVSNGTATTDEVFAVVDARVAKRTASKRPQILRVVQYRNELAKQLGKPTIAEPVYQAKAPAASMTSPMAAVSTGMTADEVADRIQRAGIDITSLITSLAGRIGSKA